MPTTTRYASAIKSSGSERVLAGEEPTPIKRPANPDILMKSLPVEVRRHEAAAHDVTAIEVVAADRKGLLASLAAAIAEIGVDLRGANVATFGEKAVDIFFLTDSSGGKLDEARTTAIIDALRRAAVLDAQADAAA